MQKIKNKHASTHAAATLGPRVRGLERLQDRHVVGPQVGQDPELVATDPKQAAEGREAGVEDERVKM